LHEDWLTGQLCILTSNTRVFAVRAALQQPGDAPCGAPEGSCDDPVSDEPDPDLDPEPGSAKIY